MNKVALILAAGRGTRMKSATNKVLHPLLGRSMVGWVIDAVEEAGLKPIVVVGHQGEQVRAAFENHEPRIAFATQSIPKGTGHAVLSAISELPEEGLCVVMCGDTPLFRASTLNSLFEHHRSESERKGHSIWVTVLSACVSEPAAYGRIVRDENGAPLRITEAANATKEELSINEINTGTYLFDLAWLRSILPTLSPHPPKQEIYLTDALELAADEGRAAVVAMKDPKECQGVNDRWALSEAQSSLQERIVREWASKGVGFEDPYSVTLEPAVELSSDVYIERGAILRGNSKLGTGVRVGAYSVIQDTLVAEDVVVHPYTHIVSAQIEDGVSVGPFARIREGTRLGEAVKIGNFVETKKANFESGSKASHLSYIGDAQVGSKANIGAGTITCNYDGYAKHKTNIGAGAFIGSNTALVAPVKVGAGAIIGAGSTITKSVSEDDISVARADQQTRPGAAKKFRARREAK